MQFLLGFLLLLLGWLQPVHVFPWLTWQNEFLAFSAVLVIGWQAAYVCIRKRKSHCLEVPIIALPMLGLVALVGIQWGSGLLIFSGDAIAYAAYFGLCALSLCVAYSAQREHRPLTQSLAITLLLGAFCSTVIAFAQTLEVWDTCEWIHRISQSRRSGANIGQPNQLATLQIMGLVSLLYLYAAKKIAMVAATLIALVLMAALAATESRTGVLSFCVLCAWWFYRARHLTLSVKSWSVAGFITLYLVLFGLWPQVYAEVFQITGGLPGRGEAAYSRWTVWSQLVQAVMMKPWFGWGFGQVSSAHNAVVSDYAASEPFTYAHNVAIDFAIGFGLPLTLALAILVGVWLWRRASTAQTIDTWYCLAVVIPVAVHSLLEFPHAYSYFLVPVMLALGSLEGYLDRKPVLKVGAKAIVGLSVFATVMLVWSSVEYLTIEDDFRVARFEALRVGKAPMAYERPRILIFTQLDALLSGIRLVPRADMQASEIELARSVAMQFPWTATINRYALVLALNGNTTEATRQLKVIRALYGETHYQRLKIHWQQLQQSEYPQLQAIQLP